MKKKKKQIKEQYSKIDLLESEDNDENDLSWMIKGVSNDGDVPYKHTTNQKKKRKKGN